MSILNEYLKNNQTMDTLRDLGLQIKNKDNYVHISYDRSISNMENNIVKECRGVIYDLDTKKIISISLKCKNTLEHFLENVHWNNCVIEESIDGTLINLFYSNNVWRVSTKKTFDAECKWLSTKTFRELFWETLNNESRFNLNHLNKDFCYSFILCHPECRNITKYDKPMLFHISSIYLNNLNEYDEDIGIQKPSVLKLDNYNILNCHSYNELLVKLDKLHYTKEGFMLYSKDRKYRTKLFGKEHLRVKDLKGSYSVMDLRIVELRGMNNKLNEFLEYFPEYKNNVDIMENRIKKIGILILQYYTLVKKEKKQTDIPPILKKVIYELHGEYIKLKAHYNPLKHTYKPTITLAKIMHWLNHIHPKQLCNILNWYQTI